MKKFLKRIPAALYALFIIQLLVPLSCVAYSICAFDNIEYTYKFKAYSLYVEGNLCHIWDVYSYGDGLFGIISVDDNGIASISSQTRSRPHSGGYVILEDFADLTFQFTDENTENYYNSFHQINMYFTVSVVNGKATVLSVEIDGVDLETYCQQHPAEQDDFSIDKLLPS